MLCMTRLARIVIPGCAHHITQRGNNRQDVFFVDDDRLVYLAFLRKAAAQHGLAIDGYCLMTNHVHLIATPTREDSLAKAVGRTHLLYAQYVNRMHGRSGHLWQNRFFSCALDGDHYWTAMRYVERNPVRARMLRIPWRYKWSSATAHTGRGDQSNMLDLAAWRRDITPQRWEEMLTAREDEAIVDTLRMRTQTGRPLASDRFLSKLEAKLGRRVRPLPVCRQVGWRKET